MIVTKDSGENRFIQITDTGGFAENRINLGAAVGAAKGTVPAVGSQGCTLLCRFLKLFKN